ncbi:hypothetical protein ACVNPZ_14180 [Staphylococcus aureus]
MLIDDTKMMGSSLVEKRESDAVITDTDEALKQVLKMVKENKVISKKQ